MTHRVISRNASSSRAIPTAKLLEEVRSDALRAAPVFWGKNQPGMQAAEELSDTPYKFHGDNIDEKLSSLQCAKDSWRNAALDAAVHAETLLSHGAHKQIVNRLLEPFSHINVIATATEWDNFFGLRLHKDAQPEMRVLALAMWEARKASTPKLLQPGEWHTPFVEHWDYNDCLHHDTRDEAEHTPMSLAIKVSVARCARVSYESFETGKRSTIEEDLALFERLKASGHWSPFEHQATPIGPGAGSNESWQCGNFRGWRQYRKMVPGEAVRAIPEGYETPSSLADD